MALHLVTASNFERFAKTMERKGFVRTRLGEYAKAVGDGEFQRSPRYRWIQDVAELQRHITAESLTVIGECERTERIAAAAARYDVTVRRVA